MDKCRRAFSWLLAAALLACSLPAAAADFELNEWYDYEEEYWVNAGTVTMKVGETKNLRAHMFYESDEKEIYVGESGTWSTDLPTVATVDKKGNVTAVREGRATIKVVYMDNRRNTVTRTVRLKVDGRAAVSAYKSTEYTFTVTEGKKLYLRELLFQDAPAESIKWSSDHKDLMTVDKNGLVLTKRHGTGNIYGTFTAADGTETTKKATIQVQTMITSHQFQSVAITLQPGDKLDVREMFYPGGQLSAGYDTLQCSTGNSDIASLNGYVLTAKAAGSTNLSLVLSKSGSVTDDTSRQKIKVIVTN